MIKNLYTRSVLLLVYFTLSYSAGSYYTNEPSTLNQIAIKQKNKPIIAFDLHGVIFDINYTEVIKKIALVFAQWNGLLLGLNPDFWLDLVLLFFNIRQFEFLLNRYPILYKNFENLSDIIQGHELNPIMPALFAQLKSQGYKIYLFSNIAEKNFNTLQKQFPDLFKDFDGFVVAQPDDGWIQKPNKKAYQKFLAAAQTKAEDVLLIDDQLNNIHAAQALGFQTIHYKSTEQMLKALTTILTPFQLQIA